MYRIFTFVFLLCYCIGSFAQNPILIRNINIIPMSKDTILYNKDVFLKNGIIEEITDSNSGYYTDLLSFKIIEGDQKFLVPGFTDAHVHLPHNAPQYFREFLKYGVTSLRVLAGKEDSRHLSQEDFAPHLYMAGPLIDGDPPSFGKDHDGPIISNKNDAVNIIEDIARQGFRFVKLYSRLDNESYHYLVDRARAQNLKIALHWSIYGSRDDFYQLKDMDIQHLSGYSRYASRVALSEKTKLKQYDVPMDEESSLDIDTIKLKSVIQQHIANNVSICPTLSTYMSNNNEGYNNEAKLYQNSDYSSPDFLGWWNYIPIKHNDTTQAYIKLKKHIVSTYHQQGGLVLAGTDFPVPWALPGFGVHREIREFVKNGFTNYEALKTATINPMSWLSENKRGFIAVGNYADLVILNNNPLENIDHAADVYKVILKGTLFEN